MATKNELLEEKTVKDLKQMARDKDLSGYSKMRKNELIDLIDDNYSKKEVKSWPDLESEGKGTEELEMEEIEGKSSEGEAETSTSGIEPVESMEEEIEEMPQTDVGSDLESPDSKMLLVAVVLIIIIATAIAMGL